MHGHYRPPLWLILFFKHLDVSCMYSSKRKVRGHEKMMHHDAKPYAS